MNCYRWVRAAAIMKKLPGLVCALAISVCFAPYEAIHGDELKNLESLLAGIQSNVTVIQGTEDKLVKCWHCWMIRIHNPAL